NAASSLARQRIAAAISSGWPTRPSGCRRTALSRQPASARSGAVIGVSMTPGQTQLTRTFGAHVSAIVRVRLTTPPFDAAYAGESEPPTRPKIYTKFVI